MPIQKTELTSKIEQLKELQAKTLELQAQIVDQRPAELAGLHTAYGFESVAEFIKAVKAAADAAPAKKGKVGRPKKGEKKAGKVGRPKKVVAEKKPRGRARITDDVKAQVKDLVAAGKSGSEIAKQLGISLPSVQNIKKEAGLVKARGPRAKAVAAEVEVPAAAPVVAPAETPTTI